MEEKPLTGCFSSDPVDNVVHSYLSEALKQRIASFVSRCSSFLAHTRLVPRDDTHQDHVKLMVCESQNHAEPPGNEVPLSIKHAFTIAVKTNLALMLLYISCHADLHQHQA